MWRKIVAVVLAAAVFALVSAEGSCGGEGAPGGAATDAPHLKPKETDLVVEFEWEGNARRPIYMFYSVPDYLKPADPQACPVGTHSFSTTRTPGSFVCRWHKFSYGNVHGTIWQTGAGTVGCKIATGTIFEDEQDGHAWQRIGEKLSCDYNNPKPGNA
jgi:hypothetical protein